MPRYIDADALKAKYEQMLPEIGDGYHKETLQDVLFELEYAPTVSPDEVRGVGKWIEKEVYNLEVTTIEQMQSASCSVCGKIHTTPYSYYFSKYNYCPNCGAKMEVSDDA